MVPGRGERIRIPKSYEMPTGEHAQGNGRTCAQGKSTKGRLDLPGCDGGYGAHMANLPGPARNSQTNTQKGSRRIMSGARQGDAGEKDMPGELSC